MTDEMAKADAYFNEHPDLADQRADTPRTDAEPCYRCGEILDGSLCAATGNREVCAAEPAAVEPPDRLRSRIAALAEVPFEPGPYTEGWRAAVKDALYWIDQERAAQPPRGSLPEPDYNEFPPEHLLRRGSLTATEPLLGCYHGEPHVCRRCGVDIPAGSPRGVTPALDVDLLAEVMEGMPLDPMATLAVRIASAYNARLGSPEDSDASASDQEAEA